MALFTSILAFAGNATTALATAAAPNARRETDDASRFATSGARAAAEARTNKQRIDAAVMLCDKVRRPFNRPPGSCGVRQAVGQQSGSLHKLLWCQTSPMHPVAVRNSRMQRRSW